MKFETEVIGLIGATFTTMAFLPQVVKTWKSKSVSDISIGLSLLFTVGTIFWLYYGIMINESPVIISNAITMVLTGSLLILKIKYGKTISKKSEPEN